MLLCCDWWMSAHSALSLVQTIEFDEGAGAVLRIQPLRAPRDENAYECVAKNTEGEITKTSTLSIIRGEIHHHHHHHPHRCPVTSLSFLQMYRILQSDVSVIIITQASQFGPELSE